MFGKSRLTKALEKWGQEGGSLDDVLPSGGNLPLKSKAEAEALCAALDALNTQSKEAKQKTLGSSLHTLAAFFQQVESQKAFEVLKLQGLPRLRSWVNALLDGQDIEVDDVMFILKILAMYRQPEDVPLIAAAARKPVYPDGYMWSIIFGQFDAEHPLTLEMVEALRNPLPSGFILVSYLDLANSLGVVGKLKNHPLDTAAGQQQLETWLRATGEEHFSYARSATSALPFVSAIARTRLLELALSHPDASVRMEAAWAQAKSGSAAGLIQLAELCLDPRSSLTAQQYLEELGRTDQIPAQAQQPDFRAVAEMANWLAHPMEFGRSPDGIKLYDTRELRWPPTRDTRQLWLVEYSYSNKETGEPDRGVGMVGSITFALFGETTTDLLPEDIYGLHCCWELERNGDIRAPKERSAQAGREILRHQNAGF
jgi:hypothetical protein